MGLKDFEKLQDAIDFARSQVVELAFGSNQKTEDLAGYRGGPFSHGVGIGISRRAGLYVTSEPSYGKFEHVYERDSNGKKVMKIAPDGKPQMVERESYPPDAYIKIHGHNVKTGLADRRFSPDDYDAARTGIVEKANEDAPNKWERIGPSSNKQGWEKMNADDPIEWPESRTKHDAAAATAAMLDAHLWILEQAGAVTGGPKPISPPAKN